MPMLKMISSLSRLGRTLKKERRCHNKYLKNLRFQSLKLLSTLTLELMSLPKNNLRLRNLKTKPVINISLILTAIKE